MSKTRSLHPAQNASLVRRDPDNVYERRGRGHKDRVTKGTLASSNPTKKVHLVVLQEFCSWSLPVLVGGGSISLVSSLPPRLLADSLLELDNALEHFISLSIH